MPPANLPAPLPPPPPCRPERLAAIITRLLGQGLAAQCTLLAPREATNDELHAVHSPDLVRMVEATAAAAGAAVRKGREGAGDAARSQVLSSCCWDRVSLRYKPDV